MKSSTLSLAISTAILLTACGGGGSGTGGSVSGGTSNTTTTGLVGDGYIQGAYVCHDLNDNLSCVDEGAGNYATTDASGAFDTTDIANYDATLDLLVEVPIGAQDNGPYVDVTELGPRVVQAPVWFVLPSGASTVFASPFSTLINSVMQRDSSLSIIQAEDVVKARLGFANSSISLFDDYLSGNTQNNQLHAFAEVITSALLENMGDLQNQTLPESEKLWFATQHVFQNLGNLRANLPNLIPSDFDPTEYDKFLRFSDDPTIFANQIAQLGARSAVVNVDACTRLNQGLYAYEHWRTSSSSTDDAYGPGPETDSEVKTMGIDGISNKLYQTSFEYHSAGVGIQTGDSRSSTIIDGTFIDITNLTIPGVQFGEIALFDAENTACIGNQASFSRSNSLGNVVLNYDMYINANDVSGAPILSVIPNLEAELTNPNAGPINFPANSEQVTGQIYITEDIYIVEDDVNDTQITNSSGSPMNSITWSSVGAGDTFYFNQGWSSLTIDTATTATFTDVNTGTSTTGTWGIEGSGVNQFLQTNISMDDDIRADLFIAGVAGAFRAGEKTPAGTTFFIGNPNEDVMDDIMFNKTAHFALINAMNNADLDGDSILNIHDNDDDGDNVNDAIDVFPADINESVDTDGDGVGDNSDAFPNDPSQS